jgi:hypothetical protein
MKKISLILMMTFLGFSAFSQNVEGQGVVTLDAGYSIYANAVKLLLDGIDGAGGSAEASLTPVIMVGFDYALTDIFSMGVMGAYQNLGADFQYTWNNGTNDITESVNTAVTRMNFAVTPKFHYGGSENLDLYSGLRVGMNILNFTQNSTDPDFDVPGSLSGSRLTIGVTAFGARYFFTDNIGMNMELSVGTPYAVAAGVNWRF